MIRHVIGIDPGTKMGIAYNRLPDWGIKYGPFPMPCPDLLKVDTTPASGKPGKPAKPATKRRGPVPATKDKPGEPEYYRCGKILDTLSTLILDLISPPPGCYAANPSEILVITETSAHFTSREDFIVSKKSQQVASEIRGIIKAVCYTQGVFYSEVESDRLIRWVFGGRPAKLYTDKEKQRAHLKSLKVNAARTQYRYGGNDNDVADAIHIFSYGWANAKYFTGPQSKLF